jgi:hypothetical protein
MARGRLISRCLSTSRKFGTLPAIAGNLAEFCQALYPLVVVHTDDFGRMSGDAWTIKFQVHPSSPRKLGDFERALSLLERAGLLFIYDDGNGGKCLQVQDFETHQPGLHKRTASKFPEPPGSSRRVPDIPSELNRTEGKGTEEEQNRTEGADAPGAIAVPEEPKPEDAPTPFEQFWELYPRKVGKGEALKLWTKINPSPELVERILDSVWDHRAWPDWRKDRGAFIPHPSTFLSQERWEDEPIAAGVKL